MSRKKYKILKWIFGTAALLFVISAFINFWFGKGDIQSINAQFGFALFPIGIAAYAVSLAFSSEEKMIALTNLNFIEKHAVIQDRISEFKNQNYNNVEKCKLDFEAAIEVKEWASPEKKEEYIEDLIKLIETRLRTHTQKENKQTVEEILISMIDKAIASNMTTKNQTKRLAEKKEGC